MSWNRQMEEIVSSWTDMQRRMWDGWVDSVKRFGGDLPQGNDEMQQEYHKRLEAWEASVNQALEAQSEWARKWSGQMQADQQPPEIVAQWTGQVQEMMKGWTDSQQQLWEAWFESVRTMDPSQAANPWGNESKQVMEAWQQAAERAQETLANWARQAQQAGEDVQKAAEPSDKARKAKSGSTPRAGGATRTTKK
ncbi:MAG: hypothetical protein WED00_14625 [Aquisalimonadaceae bacterium]